MYLFKDLVEKFVIFALVWAFEIYCFAIVALMLNAAQEDNTVWLNLGNLLTALLYGEFTTRLPEMFVLQVVFSIGQILMFLVLIVYMLTGSQKDFTPEVVKDLLEMDRIYGLHEMKVSEQDWLSLVRPIQIFSPLITFVQLPIMLCLTACAPTFAKVLNERLLWLFDLPSKLVFRIQLLIASIIITPSAYLFSIATLLKAKRANLSFILLAPVLLPLTAIWNEYTSSEDQPSAHFELEWE
jgi:hypothetical protein